MRRRMIASGILSTLRIHLCLNIFTHRHATRLHFYSVQKGIALLLRIQHRDLRITHGEHAVVTRLSAGLCIKRRAIEDKFEHGAAFVLLGLLVLCGLVAGGIVYRMLRSIDDYQVEILLTLALAIFDLVKTLFEEEVLGSGFEEHNTADPHKTMVRFLGSIIIALSIEALMLVFKFAMTEPDKLVTSLYIIGGVSMLLISLAVYIKFTGKKIARRQKQD